MNVEQQISPVSPVSPVVSQTAGILPRWAKWIFKIYGGLNVAIVIIGFVGLVSSIALVGGIPPLQIIASFIIMAAYSLTVGFGSWYLKRWVVPLFGLVFLTNFASLFVSGVSTTSFQAVLATIIGAFVFGLGYKYRDRLSGKMVSLLPQLLFVITGILILVLPRVFPISSLSGELTKKNGVSVPGSSQACVGEQPKIHQEECYIKLAIDSGNVSDCLVLVDSTQVSDCQMVVSQIKAVRAAGGDAAQLSGDAVIQLIRQGRDANRLSDLSVLNTSLALYLADVGGGAFCLKPGVVFSSLAGSKGVNGTGWLPIDFTRISGGSPLSILPLDAVNETPFSYTFLCMTGGGIYGNYELNAVLESDVYKIGGEKSFTDKDGGNNASFYEVGTNLKLIP
ncbi:MAG: hypothetical protein Q8P01_05485 [bacterium]|nr:hypothetical protein [bacterium]